MKHLDRSLCTIVWAMLACVAVPTASAQDHSQHRGHTPPEPSSHSTASHQESAREATERTESERRHVPPDPPQHQMGDMSNAQMIELMAMDDAANLGMVLLDQLEWRRMDREEGLGVEVSAWYGNDYDKAWFKAEGEIVDGEYEGRNELLWDRVASRWFNLQAGVRHDAAEGRSRSWLALGVQGLAPYWFDIEAAVYVGDAGRTALRFSAEYEVLITQRLILQPEIDIDFYGKDDARNGIGAGLSETELGLRLRYEIRRELAPYVGVVRSQRHGTTADFARAEGLRKSEVELTAGVRIWW